MAFVVAGLAVVLGNVAGRFVADVVGLEAVYLGSAQDAVVDDDFFDLASEVLVLVFVEGPSDVGVFPRGHFDLGSVVDFVGGSVDFGEVSVEGAAAFEVEYEHVVRENLVLDGHFEAEGVELAVFSLVVGHHLLAGDVVVHGDHVVRVAVAEVEELHFFHVGVLLPVEVAANRQTFSDFVEVEVDVRLAAWVEAEGYVADSSRLTVVYVVSLDLGLVYLVVRNKILAINFGVVY